MRYLGYAILASMLLLMVTALTLADFSNDNPELTNAAPQFQGDFLALSDSHQSASTYATGQLERLADGRDELRLFRSGVAQGAAQASNSVVGWPETIAVSADGRFAFTVETRGPPPANLDSVPFIRTALAPGRRLHSYSITADDVTELATLDDIGLNPQSIAFDATNRYLVVATETDGEELVIIPVNEAGGFGETRRIAIPFDRDDNDTEPELRSLHPSPDGNWLAANVANHRVQFFKLETDADGIPVAASRFGEATPFLGRRIAVGRWTSDSRHFLISDTHGGGGSLYMLQLQPGSIMSLRPPASRTR